MAKKKDADAFYKEVACEKCGWMDSWNIPFEGVTARKGKQFVLCGKCGHKQITRPGDMYRHPHFLEIGEYSETD